MTERKWAEKCRLPAGRVVVVTRCRGEELRKLEIPFEAAKTSLTSINPNYPTRNSERGLRERGAPSERGPEGVGAGAAGTRGEGRARGASSLPLAASLTLRCVRDASSRLPKPAEQPPANSRTSRGAASCPSGAEGASPRGGQRGVGETHPLTSCSLRSYAQENSHGSKAYVLCIWLLSIRWFG